MNTQKHTPGPWTVETVPTSIGHAHKIQPIGACLYVDHRDAKGKDAKTLDAAANAALIAAAPDLLEACKWFMAQLETGSIVRDITKDGSPAWASQMARFVMELNKVAAAIARAETI